MAYTAHGHHIPGTDEKGKPEEVARCGGLRLCGQCKREAAAIFGVRMDRGEGLSLEELNKRFGLHKAAIEGPNALRMEHATLRTEFMEFAQLLSQYLPEGRNKSLALTALEEASMWAHKSLANDTDV